MGITKNKQSRETIKRMAASTYPDKQIVSCTELTEGLCNVAYFITFSDGEKRILKIAAADNHGYMTNVIGDADKKSIDYFISGKELLALPEKLTDFQMRRIYWYDLLLYLTMMTEGQYREYADDSQYHWIAPLFQASLKELV